jgi:UDP-N-acetylglucosamine acyltransferase
MIHPTAIIHPSAKIDPSVEIGPYAVIGEDTVINAGVIIKAHATVEFATVGEKCTIFSGAAVGGAPQDLKYNGERTTINIGPRCLIREFVTLNRGTAAHGKTEIGSDCLFMAYTHIAHDCIVGNGVIMSNGATVGGHAEIGDNAVISSMVGIHQFTRIGRLAMIGGGAMVPMDIMPFAQAQGDRARLVGLNLVGLRRKGYSRESIEEIKYAYKLLFTSGIPMREALDQLEASKPGAEVREIIEFFRTSKRGITRAGRRKSTEDYE